MAHFFVDYIINDNLGRIANAFIAFADFEYNGASCEQCLKLAELHSIAVDFIKSGIPAHFPYNLQPDLIPSFMENGYKKSYESEKILGKIHRECNSKLLLSSHHPSNRIDEDLLIPGFQEYVADGMMWLNGYNWDLWHIMIHYG